ncbi:BppU family phage baseplate upper protein, partial [Staphylococcus arlettae]|uniref:BppU family phage baseplate upper protein n=1 Tax=Staphylococcus arlettae TaxID=29378 RepID=UPI0028A55278
MAMDKIGKINLETSANYQSLSDLNIQFWNQDKNTAVLQFQITRNNFPLSLSKENVEVFIKLESGANYIVDSTEVADGGFVITDELNGIVSYTIPTEFMTVAQSVTGQVYVATQDQEEVVVQRKFSFEVSEDLLSTIPASEKLKEIKLFAQLRDEVSDTMAKLNEDFANMQDYVTMVNQAATDGVNQLNTLSEDKLTDYNNNHTSKLNEITTTGDSYTAKLI